MKKILAITAVLLLLVASMGPSIADTHGQNETTDMVSQVTGETTQATPPSPPPLIPPPANKPPVAEAGPNQTVYVDELTHFSGAGSFDPDGTILFYDWDFGDGTTASGMNVSHAYSEPGIYTATLTVMDDRIADDSDTCTITVRETPPIPPPPPPPPLPPILDNLTITPAELELGDNVTIKIDIMNIDSQSITYAVDIHIENVNDPPPTWPPMDVYLRIWVDLKAYESKTVSHTMTMDTGGDFNVTVAGMTGSFKVGTWPPEPPLKPAEFEISELEALGRQALIHDDKERPIIEGEHVIFSVLVINIGETEGNYTVEFKVDGETIDTYNWTLLAGRGHRALVYYEALNAGTYQVSVGNLTDTFTVREPLEPAKFEFSNLQITPRVKIGMSVNISVDVTNVGEEMGFCTFELKVNGRVVDSVEIPSFGGGVTATQFFELTRGEGTYEVEVEGLTGSFTVFTIPEPPFWTTPEFIMAVIIIIVGIVAIYLWRRGSFEGFIGPQGPQGKSGENL